MNKELISYQETIFSKINRILNHVLLRKEDKMLANKITNQKTFLEDIIVKQNKEENRLKKLKKLYDKGELEEKYITNEDIDKLIEMYDEEIEKLTVDTKRRKNNIQQMLKPETTPLSIKNIDKKQINS